MISSSVAAGRQPRAFVRLCLAPMGLGLWVTALHAQSSSPALVPVVVTASRTPMRVDQTLADVTVLDREDIERSGQQSLPQLLAMQPGVQLSTNGGLGKSSSVFLRGLEARHTLLLIDGVRYGSATTGTPSWENLPLGMIERIEIVRGPLSGLYGSDAVGGVIQVFTRKGVAGLHPNAQLTTGSNRYGQVGTGLSWGQGALDGTVQVQHTETRGISSTSPRVQFGNFNGDRDPFRQDAASARLGLQLGEGWRTDAQVLQADSVTQFDDGPQADSRAKLRTQVLWASVQGRVNPLWGTVLRVSRAEDVYDTRVSSSSLGLGAIGTVQRQLSWENTVPTAAGDVLLLAENTQQNVSRPGAAFSVTERSIHGVAVGLDGHRGVHHWQANLRRDENSQFGGQTNGALGYGYDLTPAWRAAGAFGTSFVVPSFNQLYYPGFGNPNLQPEEGDHREASLRWKVQPGQDLKLTWFDNRIRGYISSGPAPLNIPRTRIDGLSLSHSASWGPLTTQTTLEHVDPRNVTPGANADKQLPRRAKDSLKLAADMTQGAWQWGGVLSAYSERFDNLANTLHLGGYATLDLRADWRVARDWTLGWRLNNVADKRYETAYGYNQPGREALVTLRYSGL